MRRRRAIPAVLLLLVAGCEARGPSPGTRAREAFVRTLAEREGLTAAWQLMSRSELEFADGLSPITCIDPYGASRAYETGFDCMVHSGAPVRWMGPRAHLRVRGDRPMRLWLRAHVNVAEVFTTPTLTVALEGAVVTTVPVAPSGDVAVEVEIPLSRGDGWREVYLTLSSVGEPWRDPAKLAVARLDAVRWEPVAP